MKIDTDKLIEWIDEQIEKVADLPIFTSFQEQESEMLLSRYRAVKEKILSLSFSTEERGSASVEKMVDFYYFMNTSKEAHQAQRKMMSPQMGNQHEKHNRKIVLDLCKKFCSSHPSLADNKEGEVLDTRKKISGHERGFLIDNPNYGKPFISQPLTIEQVKDQVARKYGAKYWNVSELTEKNVFYLALTEFVEIYKQNKG